MVRGGFGVMLAIGLAASHAAAEERPSITGIAQVTFLAHDLDATRAYYARLLGYDASDDTVRINARQTVKLEKEPQAGTDRLVGFALATPDAEALRRFLAAKGVRAPDAVTVDRTGAARFSVIDPDGHRVEFVQQRVAGAAATNGGAEPISTDLRHVGILVRSLSAATEFYGGLLGFKEFWRGSSDGIELSWVNMQVPDGDNYLEFMLYRDLPAGGRLGSLHHICLFVNDIDKAKAVVAERASRVGYARALEIRTGVNRKRQLNLFDPDGTRTELMEPRTVDGVPARPSTAPPPRP